MRSIIAEPESRSGSVPCCGEGLSQCVSQRLGSQASVERKRPGFGSIGAPSGRIMVQPAVPVADARAIDRLRRWACRASAAYRVVSGRCAYAWHACLMPIQWRFRSGRFGRWARRRGQWQRRWPPPRPPSFQPRGRPHTSLGYKTPAEEVPELSFQPFGPGSERGRPFMSLRPNAPSYSGTKHLALGGHIDLVSMPVPPDIRWDPIEVGICIAELTMGAISVICRRTHLSQPVA